MIRELSLNGIATFTEPTYMRPLKINLCYGSNGSGKTTISNIIAERPEHGAQILWSSPRPLQTLVYNRDFVRTNFGETAKIGGIFTLGKDSKEAQEFIAEQRIKADECVKLIEGFNRSKEQLIQEQQRRDSNLDDICWNIKSKYGHMFSEAFSGLNNSRKKFRARCISEAQNVIPPLPSTSIDELKRHYAMAFGKARPIYPVYALIDSSHIEQWEQCDLLAQKIMGSADAPIGTFIKYLNNSDWIKQGIPYTDKTEGKCPFCQQDIPPNTREDIKNYFDDSYKRDLTHIKTFLACYSDKSKKIISQLQAYTRNPFPILDYSLFKAEFDALVLMIDKNVKEIERKIYAPSIEVNLASLCPILERINAVLVSFNKDIEESNDFAKHQKTKQQECIKNVWGLVVSALRIAIDSYSQYTQSNQNRIKELDDNIESQTEQQRKYDCLISEKEATLTSVKPTADAINAILSRFGFEGFSITENQSEPGTYRIIRADCTCVDKTLSEGEYNFISFLYFYCLVYGSQAKTGIARSKVVVFDDPTSSLDSNVLFIVSTLTKQIIDDCRNNREGIQQVFVFTHNVYFHKEVSCLAHAKYLRSTEVAFWVVKKYNNISRIIDYKNKNPIQTSYELLWAELKDTKCTQRVSIFNTLRHILEYYFNVIGCFDYEKCIHEFDGADKLLCKSLISGINEGAHAITDDFVMQYESTAIDNYIRVFKLIFQKMGHSSHYNMMMGISPEMEQDMQLPLGLSSSS
ncbi:MAG: AAA family ATPase [Treponema sp.]|jgi:wobble nucleotide-excising tRNase|nr:AAA family ATPase [Treponema sp.]